MGVMESSFLKDLRVSGAGDNFSDTTSLPRLCDVNAELATPCKEAVPNCNVHLEHTEKIPFLFARHNA